MQPDELSIIDRFFRPLAGEGSFGLRDDAGILSVPAGSELVVTTDMIARSIHFLPGDPADTVAQKALRVNISDLAAKGASPLAYVLSLGLSPDLDEAWLAAFADGLRSDQARFSIRLLGGDTIAVPDRPVISVAAFGVVPKGRMVRRSGGRPGDELYVSGMIGSSGAGLALLNGEPGPWSNMDPWERDVLVRSYRVPEPRVALAPVLLEFASAAMDVSDGLVGDCDKLCEASGCSALIEAEKVPLPPGLARAADAELLARLLTGGEDFEILASVPPGNTAAFREKATKAGVPVMRIGTLREGRGSAGVVLNGRPLPLTRRAFVHGRT